MWKLSVGLFLKEWAVHVGFWFSKQQLTGSKQTSCLTGSKGIRAHPGTPIITTLHIQEEEDDDDFHHHHLFFGKGGLQRALVFFNLLEQRLQRCWQHNQQNHTFHHWFKKRFFFLTNGVIMLTREIFWEETWIEKNKMVVGWGFV